MVHLCNLLGQKTITDLGLDSNSISAKGAGELSEVLNKTNLVRINLGHNKIGDEGAKCLGEALKSNKTLKELDLRCNEIGLEGMGALFEALKGNSTLDHLELGAVDERIKEKAARMLPSRNITFTPDVK